MRKAQPAIIREPAEQFRRMLLSGDNHRRIRAVAPAGRMDSLCLVRNSYHDHPHCHTCVSDGPNAPQCPAIPRRLERLDLKGTVESIAASSTCLRTYGIASHHLQQPGRWKRPASHLGHTVSEGQTAACTAFRPEHGAGDSTEFQAGSCPALCLLQPRDNINAMEAMSCQGNTFSPHPWMLPL